MDTLETLLRAHFDASRAPAGLERRLARQAAAAPLDAERTAARFRIEAGERGVRRVELGSARGGTIGHRRLAERAREELAEYLAGVRTFFSVPVDLSGVPEFQGRVLAAAARIPYGETTSYAALARTVGHPRAARAVGNALGANPVPVIVPCHRIVRGDGTWGHYAFGAGMKTALLTLERHTPTLIGSDTTRIVCRRGCAHEQRIQERHRIVFASVPDARSVGYRPCLVCRPPAAAYSSRPSRRRSES
jgi:methylated-DNA-[protein]-cysteine S-methyltransferase